MITAFLLFCILLVLLYAFVPGFFIACFWILAVIIGLVILGIFFWWIHDIFGKAALKRTFFTIIIAIVLSLFALFFARAFSQ